MAEEEKQQDPRSFVNTFTQGVLTDIDHINFPEGKYKDAKNIELIDRDGQGFVMTLQDGNEALFSLTTGYKPVGSHFINGILYIFSVKKEMNKWLTEIGSFPSLVTASASNTEFERVYKPLQNYVGSMKQGSRRAMRTHLIPIAEERLLDVRAKQAYDGSINLYFTDGVNPLRVINTGFNQEGNLTNKVYIDAEFKHVINVIRGAGTLTNISLNKFREGGRWKSGNTFLYVRYVSEDFNKTNFLAESSAIAVTNHPVKTGVSGNPGTHAIDDFTSKSLEVSLKQVDTSYKFIEIAFVRYYSEENGIQVQEQKLINNRYPITQSSMTLKLTGFEEFIDIDFQEIIKPNNQENVCETIEVLENRLWGANWSRDKVHDDSLAQFALGIKPYPKVTEIVKSPNAIPSASVGYTYRDQSIYSDPSNYDKIGYFRGETYMLNAVYLYDDGSESLGYPTSGLDFFDVGSTNWNKEFYNTSSKTNTKGVIRFPSTPYANPYYITYIDGRRGINYRIMGLEFSFDKNIVLPPNVKGFYITRAERIPNLVFQGVAFPSCVSTVHKMHFPPRFQNNFVASYQDNSYTDFYTLPFTDVKNYLASTPDHGHRYWGYSESGGYNRPGNIHPSDYNMGEKKAVKSMPIYKGYYPVISYYRGTDWRYAMARAFRVNGHYGIFSPDYILDATKKINNGVISPIGRVKYYDMYPDTKIEWDDYASRWDENLKDGSDLENYTKRRNALFNGVGYPRMSLLELKSTEFFTSPICITPESFENVERYTTPPKSRKFVSWYKDCGLNNKEKGNQGDEAMVYGIQRNDDDHVISNRSMVTPRYLGLVLDSYSSLSDYEMNIINSYHHDPKSMDYNILDIYNLNSTSFSKISQVHSVSETTYSTFSVFNGDCFLQTSYIKIMGHGGSTLASSANEFAGDDGSFIEPGSNGQRHIGHGLIAMFVTENSINAELRIPEKNRTFFPFEPDPVIHAQINSESKERSETDVLNRGYHKILPPRLHAAYNFELPDSMNLFPNRVRYSNKNIPGSYIDAFSTFEFLSYKDFDVSSGAIKRLHNLSGWLIGVCESKLLGFYVNSNQVKADPSADNILLGVSDILHENSRTLADLGSQHFSGSINTGKTIVGLDWINKSIFSIILQSSDSGGSYPAATNKSEELSCKRYVESVIDQESGAIVDKTNMLEDLPWQAKGVYCSNDNGRVFISVHGDEKISFVFNENLGVIIGKSDFVPVFASNIGKELLSWNGSSQSWITTKGSPKSTYFGQTFESYVQPIVNPFGIFEKVYDALVIHVPDKGIKRIEYKTETQETTHIFPIEGDPKKPWQDPVYKEDKLYVPTFPESRDIYGKKRHIHLRGTWLAIKIVFDRNTPTYLKNIFTKFRISKS